MQMCLIMLSIVTTYDDYSMSIIRSKELYAKRIQEIEKQIGKLKDQGVISDTVPAATDRQKTNTAQTNYHKVTYYYTMYTCSDKER